MSRFKRLADLRRIREESLGMACARVALRKEGLQQEMIKLDAETDAERIAARHAIGQADALPPHIIENFLKGQVWRRERLNKMVTVAQQDLDKAKEAWLAARVQLKQAEKLAEKEALQRRIELERREKKMMDMIGLMKNSPFPKQQGAL